MIGLKKVFVDFDKCLGCHTCELACATAHSQAKTLLGAVLGGEKPPISIRVIKEGGGLFPLQCRHCTDAPCVKVCRFHALTRDEETGRVDCDLDRCIGCTMCVMVCPFGAINESNSHKVFKCDLCREVGEPSCVAACPTKALIYEEVGQFSSNRRHDFVVNYQAIEGE
ncbi:MAG: 4Fe-4S dicluster domain-containing protein [Coriobacteriales bacterium]|nr:4Fe-4S dicluster domain-containing protein [Coriobacteriales bacterium]